MRDLPPLNAVRVFEACARHGNLSRAAVELGISQSAVSRQVQQLEGSLNLQLFRRVGRRVQLTLEGRDYQHTVRQALDMIAAKTRELSRQKRRDVLVVSTLPSFATKWLAPRLRRLCAALQDMELRIVTAYELVDFDRDGIDVAIRFGPGSWPGLYVERLTVEEIFPVCSPELVQAVQLSAPADLLRLPLLHGEVTEGWADWFQLVGLSSASLPIGVRVKDSCTLIEAAIEGQGVTLAQHTLVAADLAAGRLLRPFAPAIRSRHAYHFVCPPAALAWGKAAAFRSWLLAEMT
jgi:LysR family transcriptional regulator, glycine cleavage system transcriptional activator